MPTAPRRKSCRPSLSVTRLEDRLTPAGVPVMGPHPLGAFDGFAGTGFDAWAALGDAPPAPAGFEQVIRPDRFLPFRLDTAALAAALPDTVHSLRPAAPADRPVVTLPKPDGTLERFEVYGADVVPAELWGEGLQTFRGVGLDDPAAVLVADLTAQGFHAQVQTPGGWWYIDPLFHGATDVYQSYARADYTQNPHGGGCDCLLCRQAVADLAEPPADAPTTGPVGRGGVGGGPGFPLGVPGELTFGSTLRTYRTAVSTDAPYFTYHQGAGTAAQKAANVLGAVATALNRVSGIYETELAVRFQLVPNNDLVIYGADGTDPYTDGDAGTAINQIQSELDAVIGAANYEVGHLFSGDGDYQGLAGLGVIAQDGAEGRGVTGLSAPIGDVFAVDYVAHEIGHQAGGNHTFAGFSGAPATTRVEPGSGSTIMAYAGLGGSANDYASNSDPMFSWTSLREMSAYLSGTFDGGFAVAATNNTAPRVFGGGDYVIPARTFFALTAAATDPDGDPVTYSWEQADSRAANTALSLPDPGANAPLVRPYRPTASPERSFPRLAAVLASTVDLSQTTGTLNLDGTAKTGNSFGYVRGERLPLTSRDLNFVVVARDGKAGGGSFSYDRVTLRSVNTGSAFAVTLASGLIWAAGSTQTVTWNVAGTTGNGINTDQVRILLSTDGGLTFPTVLAERTANDGTEAVTLPLGVSSAANGARIRVEPTNSVYFALSNKLTVAAAGAAPAGTVSGVTFTDRNANGLRDGEPAAPGRLVYADADGNGRFDNGLPLLTLTGAYPLPLADRTITRVPFNLAGAGGSVADLRVRLNITHPNPSELDAFLVSPSGRRVELFTALGASGANVTDLLLSAAAATGVNQTAAPYTGTFKPEGNLLEFAGDAADGVWQLELADRVAGTTGTLNSWGLQVTTEFASTAAPFTLTGSGENRLAPLTVPALGGTVLDLDVRVNLAVGDTQSASFWLYNPAVPATASPVPAGAVQLFNRSPAFQTNFADTIFDDQAATAVTAGSGPFTGRYRPVASMLPYYDQPTDPIAGTWHLNVRSEFGGSGSEFHVGYQGWAVRVTREFPAAPLVPLAVPDNGTLLATLPAQLVGGPLQDVGVTLSLAHPNLAEVKAYLVSPAGTQVLLAAGGSGANLTATGFDDEAGTKFAAGTAPYTGLFRPVEPLARFDGEDGNGVWTLRVEDTAAGNTGSLLGWGLALTTPTRVASLEVPAAVGVAASRTSRLFVSNASGRLSDLDVTLNLTHPAVGEVTAYLLSPAGTKVTLVAAGTAGANFSGTLDDEAGVAVAAGTGPFVGRFRPSQPLSAFDGQTPNGFWTLQLDDSNLGANSGTLVGWSLSYSTGERFTTSDAAGAYTLLVPAGTFTIREELPGDATRTQPAAGGYAVTVTAGSPTFPGRDFGGTAVVTAGPSLRVNDGTAQRSRVTALTLTAFGSVTGAAAGAFTLTRTAPGGSPVAVPLTVAGLTAGPNDTTLVSFVLPAGFTEAGSLADGRYALDVNWALVTVTGPPLGGTGRFAFTRLFGDVTGEGEVNADDLTEFASAFGTSAGDAGFRAALDFDGGGQVNADDLTEFASRFGVAV